ncbi:uncharacterized protein [Populus alba]|uniref:uncharacterized protein isoform X2 n=1 Tax=Populus alba TaxID=43335 RepID=UPI003CC77DB4
MIQCFKHLVPIEVFGIAPRPLDPNSIWCPLHKSALKKFCKQHHLLQWTVLECFGGHIRHCCCCAYRTRVLEDISDSIVALYTEQGAHFLDLYPSSLSGPDWLVALREKEKQILHIGLLSSMPNMINNT